MQLVYNLLNDMYYLLRRNDGSLVQYIEVH
jgi:hypothetical protein